MDSVLKIGLAGLGTVGAAFAKMVQDQSDLLHTRTGRTLKITAICARDASKDRGFDTSNMAWYDDPVKLVNEADIDVFVELIGGAEGPARAAVEAALAASIDVVTANKALVSRHGNALAKIAGEKNTNVSLNYEAAVAGGIPVIKVLREGLSGVEVSRVYGILNGTCNYILSRMEADKIGFDACLKDAQALGYAEADPSFDVNGDDTAHKLTILTSLCFGTEIEPDQIFIEGITKITLSDIEAAKDLGYKIKLLGVAQKTEAGIEQRVHPALVPATSQIAGIGGVLNAVALEATCVGTLLLSGPGAGGEATASAVMSDVCDIARSNTTLPLGRETNMLKPYIKAPMRAHEGGYYIRLNVRDRSGAFAAVAGLMAEHDISLESVIQRPDLFSPELSAEQQADYKTVILITHETSEHAIRDVLKKIASDGAIGGETQMIRVERFA